MGQGYGGDSEIKAAYYGSDNVKAIYYGNELIWPINTPAIFEFEFTNSVLIDFSANAITEYDVEHGGIVDTYSESSSSRTYSPGIHKITIKDDVEFEFNMPNYVSGDSIVRIYRINKATIDSDPDNLYTIPFPGRYSRTEIHSWNGVQSKTIKTLNGIKKPPQPPYSTPRDIDLTPVSGSFSDQNYLQTITQMNPYDRTGSVDDRFGFNLGDASFYRQFNLKGMGNLISGRGLFQGVSSWDFGRDNADIPDDEIELSALSNLQDGERMFVNCQFDEDLPLNYLTSLQNGTSMFSGVDPNTSEKFTKGFGTRFSLPALTDGSRMFELSTMSWDSQSGFDLPELINGSQMFRSCEYGYTIDINMPKVQNTYRMFYGTGPGGSHTLHSNTLNMPAVINTEGMFYGYSNLTTIPTSGFNMPNIDNCSYMFYNCSQLTSDILPLYNYLSAQNPTYHEGCFRGCTSATNYNLIPADWK